MPFPNYPKRSDQQVIITPQQHFEAEKQDYEDFVAPKAAILCFESSLMNHFRTMASTQNRRFWTGEMIYLNPDNLEVALVGNFGIGGPAAGHMLEILIAAGIRKFMVVGHAGGLQKNNPIGSLILTDKALRDEGLSHHYLEPGKYAYPSSELVKQLQIELKSSGVRYQVGSSWTLDSMYRETRDEIQHYGDEGIATVEMELASLFAIATFRQVNIASLLVVSDYVGLEEWEEHLHAHPTDRALHKALAIAQTVLSS